MVKEFWKTFAALYFYLYKRKKCTFQIFKILFQTGDINIFVLRGAIFCRYVQLKKSSFSDEKKTAVKSETRFSRETVVN